VVFLFIKLQSPPRTAKLNLRKDHRNICDNKEKKMKKLMMVVTFVLFCPVVWAGNEIVETEKEIQETLNESWLSFEIGTKVLSKYVDNNGLELSNRTVVQSHLLVTLTHGPLSGIYGEIWHSCGTDDRNLQSTYADELDGTIGWSGDVGPLEIDAGLSYIDTINFGKPKGDVFQPFVEVSKTFPLFKQEDGPDCEKQLQKTIRPFLSAQFSIPVDGNEEGLSSGNSLFAGVELSAQVTDNLRLVPKICFVFDDGIYGYESAITGDYEITAEYQANDYVTVFATARLVDPLMESNGPGMEREEHLIYGGGIIFTF